MSLFLEDMDLYGSPVTLIGQVHELEGCPEEEKKGSCEMRLVLEASSSSSLMDETKLKEENIDHSRELKVL